MVLMYNKFNFEKYKKVDVFDKKYTEGLKFYFEDCSKNYINYLNSFYTREGGVLDGFRLIDA